MNYKQSSAAAPATDHISPGKLPRPRVWPLDRTAEFESDSHCGQAVRLPCCAEAAGTPTATPATRSDPKPPSS